MTFQEGILIKAFLSPDKLKNLSRELSMHLEILQDYSALTILDLQPSITVNPLDLNQKIKGSISKEH